MNRRTTLASLTDSQTNQSTHSKIPVSRLSMSGPRQSLGGGASRRKSNIVNDLAKMSLQSNERPARQSLAPSRQSMDPRRSSVYGKGIVKDPRNIRDRTFVVASIKTLLSYLMESNYDMPISSKILNAPSAKDFQNMFLFLYKQLDPSYHLVKKFEDEVPVMMKALKYPFAGEISKSQLQAVGSMHTWPSLLAMLVWMIELIMASEAADSSEDQESTNPESIFYEYLGKSYEVFLNGDDNYDSMLGELEENFEAKNTFIQEQVSDLSNEIEELEVEINELEASALSNLEKDQSLYESDIQKFVKFNKHQETKIQKFSEIIEKQKLELEEIEAEKIRYEEEKRELQFQVDQQDVSPEDVDRMNAEKQRLDQNLESLIAMKEELTKVCWERDNVCKQKDSQIEKTVQEYNYLGEAISIIPTAAKNSNGLNFELIADLNQLQHEKMGSISLTDFVTPNLARMKQELTTKTHQIQEQLVVIQEKSDNLHESCTDKIAELSNQEERLKKLAARYLEEKNLVSSENRSSEAEMESLENELSHLKVQVSQGHVHSQQSLQKIQIEYDQLVRRVAEEKEAAAKQIFRVLNELIDIKAHVENSAKDFEQLLIKEQQAARDL